MTTEDVANLSDEEWRTKLTPEQYRVLRKHGTETPFTGAYVHVNKDGKYRCAGCGNVLFSSKNKYESGTGWPSFSDIASSDAVTRHRDWSMLIPRTEVRCAVCDGHLGHVFGGGPKPTGQSYCINSAALRLDAKSDTDED
jgi:peptide-methionine (R)-S-oxide reductase